MTEETREELHDKLFGINNLIKGLIDGQEQVLLETTPEITSWYLLEQDALKLMEGKHGGGFYVRYLQDEASKVG